MAGSRWDRRAHGPAPGATVAVPPLLERQRAAILVMLVALTAAGWVVFLHQARRPSSMGLSGGMSASMGMGMGENGSPDLTMGGSWPLFFAMWVAMMVAMMLPAAAPMVLMYGRMQRGDPGRVTLFTVTYLSLWVAFGGAAYGLGALVEGAAAGSEWVTANWGRGGGILIVLAGAYQLSPLKAVCLRHCRSPLAFMIGHWRGGRRGAIQMGLVHGLYCMGCCWMLFLILVPLGLMSVVVMLAVTSVVFAEKVLPRGRSTSVLVSTALIAYGVAVVVHPSLLATVA